MGKQYPGEPLPRWALYSHFRTDNEPVWMDPGLLASDDDTGTATAKDAAAFCASLADRLQVDPAFVLPVSALYGTFSGIFLARAARLMRLAWSGEREAAITTPRIDAV